MFCTDVDVFNDDVHAYGTLYHYLWCTGMYGNWFEVGGAIIKLVIFFWPKLLFYA